ncbi:hypothetical protein BH23ACI1_BH23ACI1_21230 [soil metagenome]
MSPPQPTFDTRPSCVHRSERRSKCERDRLPFLVVAVTFACTFMPHGPAVRAATEWKADMTETSVRQGGSAVLESEFSRQAFELTADPTTPEWRQAPSVRADRDYLGEPIAGPPTEIRSRWTAEHLYLLFICPYEELNLKPDPSTTVETPRLWNWDVAEAFIGADFTQIARYREFQVSPQGEWIDLDINRQDREAQGGMGWNSGFTVKARIDRAAKIWYGEMRIPFSAIDARPPEAGRELRLGLYRIAGVNPRIYYAWRPTGQTTFHVPEAFGTLRLR